MPKKYGQPRRSEILYDLLRDENGSERRRSAGLPRDGVLYPRGLLQDPATESTPPVPAKLKEGDEIVQRVETRNSDGGAVLYRQAAGVQGRCVWLSWRRTARWLRWAFLSGARLGMDGGERTLHGDHQRLQRLYAVLLCQRQVRENSAQLLCHQAEPPQAAKAYCDKEPLAKLFFLPEKRSLPSHRCQPGCCWWARRRLPQSPPTRQSGRGGGARKADHRFPVVPADTLELANPTATIIMTCATGALLRAEDEGEQMKPAVKRFY